jgi:hypothetical protein
MNKSIPTRAGDVLILTHAGDGGLHILGGIPADGQQDLRDSPTMRSAMGRQSAE